MRIVVPFVTFSKYGIHPIAARALDEFVPDAERIDVGSSDIAYGQLMAELWQTGEDFLIIEHDIEATANAMNEVLNCRCPWGVSPYRHGNGGYLTRSLGFARFRSQLLSAIPDAMVRVNTIDTPAPAGHWTWIDGHLQTLLVAEGYDAHAHSDVPHHHRWSSEDSEFCVCGGRGTDPAPCPTARHHRGAEECACDGIDRRRHDGSRERRTLPQEKSWVL